MLRKWTAIGYTAALATSPAWVTACQAPQATEAQDASVLFSLSSDSMRFEDPSGMDVTLVMEGVDRDAVWFTDRPVRDAGAITTSQLAAEWADGETFDQDPPNAALVLHEPVQVDDAVTETLVAEVRDASYDAATSTFRADLRVLTDEEAGNLDGNLASHGDRHGRAWPTQAGAVSLFIDSVDLSTVDPSQSPTPQGGTSAAPSSASPTASTASPSPTAVSPSASGTTAFPSPSVPTATSALPPQTKAKPNAITLCSNPSTCNKNQTANYTYNSTIYFQTTITSNVTMSSVVSHQPGSWTDL